MHLRFKENKSIVKFAFKKNDCILLFFLLPQNDLFSLHVSILIQEITLANTTLGTSIDSNNAKVQMGLLALGGLQEEDEGGHQLQFKGPCSPTRGACWHTQLGVLVHQQRGSIKFVPIDKITVSKHVTINDHIK